MEANIFDKEREEAEFLANFDFNKERYLILAGLKEKKLQRLLKSRFSFGFKKELNNLPIGENVTQSRLDFYENVLCTIPVL